jgi:hypothetical protein
LASKQTVLFCAEKKPALEVVYKKLVAAGLGDFCLKITSTAVRKLEVLADIKKRLKISKKDFNENLYKIEKKEEEEVKNKLIQYKEILHSNIGNSGIKVCDISGFTSKFSNISRTKIFLEIFNHKLDKLINVFEKIKGDEFILISNNLLKYEDATKNIIKKYGTITKHPWSGFLNTKINPYEKEKLIKLFYRLKGTIDEIENKIKTFVTENPDLKTFNKIENIEDLKNFTKAKIENDTNELHNKTAEIDISLSFFNKKKMLFFVSICIKTNQLKINRQRNKFLLRII